MKVWLHSLLLLLAAAMLVPHLPASETPGTRDSKHKQTQKKSQPAPQASSLTGCIDERESGHYILIDATKLSPIAELQAEGFPNEGFAKYLGQKVIVQGRSSNEGNRALFTVRKVETVSERCAPSPPPQ